MSAVLARNSSEEPSSYMEAIWLDIGPVDQLPALGARTLPVQGGEEIAIFRTANDAVFALRDACPHEGGPLSQGIVFGESVACPLHNWCIDLKSGTASAPDEGSVERFAVAVVDGVVELG